MSRLRRYRESAGLTQAELADRAGVSRQLIGAAESGRNLPRVDAAVAVAAALNMAVETLFGTGSLPTDVITGEVPSDGALLRVGRVGSHLVTAGAHGGSRGWGPADGQFENGVFVPFIDLRDGLVVAGCEPGLEVLEGTLRQSGAAALSVMASSAAAIDALRAGRVHAAVVHGPALARAAEVPGTVRIRLASWEVGLAGAPDAEQGWVDEALSGRLPVAQREPGAGVQQTFMTAVATSDVPGPRVRTHLEAAACASLAGIPAVTIEPAALAVGARFHALGYHDTELWIDEQWKTDPAVVEALDVITSRVFRLRLLTAGGYDLSVLGTQVP